MKNNTSLEEKLLQSRDELDCNILALRGASSFSQGLTEGSRSLSFDDEPKRTSSDLGRNKEDDVEIKEDELIDQVKITDDDGGLDRSAGIEITQREPETSSGPIGQTSRSQSAVDDEDDGATLDAPANILPVPSKEISGKSELRESAQSTCQETGEE